MAAISKQYAHLCSKLDLPQIIFRTVGLLAIIGSPLYLLSGWYQYVMLAGYCAATCYVVYFKRQIKEVHRDSHLMFQTLSSQLPEKWNVLENNRIMKIYPAYQSGQYAWIVDRLWPVLAIKALYYEWRYNTTVGIAFHVPTETQYLFINELSKIQLRYLTREQSALFAIFHELGHLEGNKHGIPHYLQEAHADLYAYWMLKKRFPALSSILLLKAVLHFRSDSYIAYMDYPTEMSNYVHSYLFFKRMLTSEVETLSAEELIGYVITTTMGPHYPINSV